MKAPSTDIMNSMARSVLTLYSYDNRPNDTSIPNVLRQCLQLIATFPSWRSTAIRPTTTIFRTRPAFFIHDPVPGLSTAENILHMLRPDSKFHRDRSPGAGHGIGAPRRARRRQQLLFTTHVVTSSGTDTYSAIAAALGSLKGPKHGGANIKVVHMFDEIKRQVGDWKDDDEVCAYLEKILHGDAFDHAGLIYGVGHAIYSKSDPRAEIFKSFVHQLAAERRHGGRVSALRLRGATGSPDHQRRAQDVQGCQRQRGLLLRLRLSDAGHPGGAVHPLFAIARISGWSAHRLEELVNGNRIIRPAYKAILPRREYKEIAQR